VSSGNYTSTGLPWNNTGEPNSGGECVHVLEPRGPDVLLAGLCVRRGCGRATVHRNADGQPEHRLADLTGWPV